MTQHNRSHDCSGQSTDEIDELAAICGIDGRSMSNCALLLSEVRHGDNSDSSSCPFGFHSGSTPLAGMGTIPSVATMSNDSKQRQELAELRREHEALKERVKENEQLRDQVDNQEDVIAQLKATIEDLEADKGRLEDRVDELEGIEAERDQAEAENDRLQERVDELENRVADLEGQPEVSIEEENNPIGSLKIGEAHVGEAITGRVSEYDLENEIQELKADLEASNTPEAGGPSVDPSDLTEIEQISLAAGDDISSVTSSVRARRAVALWRNLPKWGKKTPKGYCLRPADNPKSLLEADQDEDLAWKQYYRAAEVLESLAEGAVNFCYSDKHGKMLILHEQSEAFDRVQSSLSASSVRAEG